MTTREWMKLNRLPWNTVRSEKRFGRTLVIDKKDDSFRCRCGFDDHPIKHKGWKAHPNIEWGTRQRKRCPENHLAFLADKRRRDFHVERLKKDAQPGSITLALLQCWG